MDTKLEIKEDESLPDDVAPQNETEFFRKVFTMRGHSDAVLLDDHCDVPIKTEIKSEAPFTKHLVKQIKSEALICSDNCNIDRKVVIDEQTLTSNFGSQGKEPLLSEDPVIKLEKFNTGHEMDNKIEIKEEPLWPETETSDMCDDIEDGDFPPVNSSRLVGRSLEGIEDTDILASTVHVLASTSSGGDDPLSALVRVHLPSRSQPTSLKDKPS